MATLTAKSAGTERAKSTLSFEDADLTVWSLCSPRVSYWGLALLSLMCGLMREQSWIWGPQIHLLCWCRHSVPQLQPSKVERRTITDNCMCNLCSPSRPFFTQPLWSSFAALWIQLQAWQGSIELSLLIKKHGIEIIKNSEPHFGHCSECTG